MTLACWFALVKQTDSICSLSHPINDKRYCLPVPSYPQTRGGRITRYAPAVVYRLARFALAYNYDVDNETLCSCRIILWGSYCCFIACRRV